MEVWAGSETKIPRDTCFYLIHNGEIRESISNMVTILTTAANIGSDHPPWTQIKVFRYLQHRLSKVPCSNFLHVLERIGRVVQKMVLVDLSKLYTDFAAVFIKGLARSSPKVKLPSCVHLEYILMRTQGSAKLICEALSYLRNIFCYLVERLSNGPDFFDILSACSVIAKISTYFKGLLCQVCNMYLKIKPFLGKLQTGNFKWEHELNLPENLWSWCHSEESFDISESDLPAVKVRLVAEMLQKSNDKPKTKENREISVIDEENELLEKNGSDDDEVIFLEKDQEVNSKYVVIDLEEENVVNQREVKKVKKKKRYHDSSPSKSRKKKKLEEVVFFEEVKKKRKKESNISTISKRHRRLELALFELKNEILKARTFEELLSIWEDIKTDCKLIRPEHLSAISVKQIIKLFRKLQQKLTFNAEGITNLDIDKVVAIAKIFANRLILNFNEN